MGRRAPGAPGPFARGRGAFDSRGRQLRQDGSNRPDVGPRRIALQVTLVARPCGGGVSPLLMDAPTQHKRFGSIPEASEPGERFVGASSVVQAQGVCEAIVPRRPLSGGRGPLGAWGGLHPRP